MSDVTWARNHMYIKFVIKPLAITVPSTIMKGFVVVASPMSVNSVGKVLFLPAPFEYMNKLILERNL